MYKKIINSMFIFFVLIPAGLNASVNKSKPHNDYGHRDKGIANSFNVSVPSHEYDLILARPEKNSITLSILTYQDMEGFVTYGINSRTDTTKTPLQHFKKDIPSELVIDKLKANTRYYYQFRFRHSDTEQFVSSPQYTFRTARPEGSTFTFTLTADSHLDEHTSPQVYLLTLTNILAEKPDFHIDLGNLFMTDKHKSRDEAAEQYLAQRYYLGQIGCSIPIFLATGTHDGQRSKYNDGTADCLAVWSTITRNRYFPNPVSDDFYTGNNTQMRHCGLPEDYYAWQWGNALFVVLDPFMYSTRQRGNTNGWGWSLGIEQYHWLERTLKQSKAKFKFVFIHNLLCGDQASRGGVEVASFNEWGGKNQDGSDGFKEHRPGWDMPIHQLLVANNVDVVFKAHDNFYARQKLDGIVYEMVPQPSFSGNDRVRDLDTYGYKQGVFFGNSGNVRVAVSPNQVKIDYVRTHLASDKNGEISDSYTITK